MRWENVSAVIVQQRDRRKRSLLCAGEHEILILYSVRLKTMFRTASRMRVGDILASLLFGCGVFIPVDIRAQYFVGVHGGPLWLDAAGYRVTNANAFDLGACLIQRTDEPIGYAAHIDWQRRQFRSQGYEAMTGSDRYFDLDMRVDMLAIGCDARIALNERRTVYFDLGPEFGIQFSEDKDGIAYTQVYAFNDTITYHHASRSLFALHDVRFRAGLSGDVPLSQNVVVTFGLHGSIGGGNWVPGGPIVSLGLQASAGVLFAIPFRMKRK